MTFKIPSRRREESKFFVWFWWWCQPSALCQPWQFCINLGSYLSVFGESNWNNCKNGFFVILRWNMLTLLGRRRRCGDAKAFFEERRSTGHNTLRRKTDVDEPTNTLGRRETLWFQLWTNEANARHTHNKLSQVCLLLHGRSWKQVSKQINTEATFLKRKEKIHNVYSSEKKLAKVKHKREFSTPQTGIDWRLSRLNKRAGKKIFCYIPDRWGLFCLCA